MKRILSAIIIVTLTFSLTLHDTTLNADTPDEDPGPMDTEIREGIS